MTWHVTMRPLHWAHLLTSPRIVEGVSFDDDDHHSCVSLQGEGTTHPVVAPTQPHSTAPKPCP